MSETLWLPPLNSHNNFSFNVMLYNNEKGTTSIPVCSEKDLGWPGYLTSQLTTCVVLYGDDDECEYVDRSYSMCGLCLRNNVKISTTSIGSDFSSILSNTVLVPFELPFERKGCAYSEYRVRRIGGLEAGEVVSCFSKHDVIEHCTNYFRKLFDESIRSNSAPNCTFMVIKKAVLVPKEEMDSWLAWRDEQAARRPGNFNEEYEQAICRLRTESELSQEATMRWMYKSTGESSIHALEEVVFDDSRKPCSVCLEELSGGQKGLKMPCLHEFHKPCIIRWLKTSHMCPMCRYILPTASS